MNINYYTRQEAQYNSRQAVELSGKPRSTVMKYARKHKLPRLGVQYIYSDTDIIAIRAIPRAGEYPRKSRAWYDANPSESPERRKARYENSKGGGFGKIKDKIKKGKTT
jgi:hypothetical protein